MSNMNRPATREAAAYKSADEADQAPSARPERCLANGVEAAYEAISGAGGRS
jgi:hypothetical protein